MIGSGVIALLGPALGRAQPAPRVMRVAHITAAGMNLNWRERTTRWFAEEGFVEGRDLALEHVDLDSPSAGETERRARAVIAGRPDVILVAGNRIDLFVHLTSEIPIVFHSYGLDPVRRGFVESLRRPGRNVTGTTLWDESVMIKFWELLKELQPRAKRLGDLWDEDDLAALSPFMAEIRELRSTAASKLGLDKVEIVVPTKGGFPPVERAIRAAKIDVLHVATEDVAWFPELRRFLERSRIPAMWQNVGLVRAGGLVSTHPSLEESVRVAVRIASQILRGANPAGIPVHFPTRFLTGINLRTARAMGLAIPSAVLLRADVVVDE